MELIPILERIARKDKYTSYSHYSGFDRERPRLGEAARKTIARIEANARS